jgi:esterase
MKLFYRKYGDGPTLIILHGLYGSSDNWIPIAKGLSDRFTIYLPDQRNHGQSPHNENHDYDSMRDDLFEFATDLKINKFFLAGHSMGGKVAIAFAQKWPEMLDGLLVVDISPFFNNYNSHVSYNQHMTILQTMLSMNLSHITSRNDAESFLKDKIPSEKIRGFILKNLRRTAGNNFEWKINVKVLLENLEKITGGIDRRIKTIKPIAEFPVIFLKGEDSDYLPSGDFSDILNLLPNSEFITVSGAGHWIHVDRPDAVIGYLKRLLTGN